MDSIDQVWEKLKLDPKLSFWGKACLGTENGGDWTTVGLN